MDEKGKKHYSHKHWSIVGDNMKFHPNSTYFYASLEVRRKLIFPSDFDLSEIEALSGTGHRGDVEYNCGYFDRMYSHLLTFCSLTAAPIRISRSGNAS